MSIKHIIANVNQAALASGLLVGLMLAGFFILEPAISRSQASDTSGPFTIRQEITGELSFITDAADVTMVSDISGLTGGQATGTTQFAVRSNSGYTVDIAFTYEGAHAMRGETTDSDAIQDYASTTAPSYVFNTASSAAVFAYTVGSSTATGENTYISDNFKDNGSSACGSGSYTAANCWMGPTAGAYEIVNNPSPAPTGATSTLTFRVYVPNSPNPAVEADWYTATATLTATEQ